MKRRLFRWSGWLVIMAIVWPSAAGCTQDAAKESEAVTSPQEEGDAGDDQDDEGEESEPAEPSPADLMQKAIAAAQGGSIDEAIEWIEKALQLAPDDIRISMTYIGALQARGMELVESGQRAAANPYFFKSATFVRDLKGPLAQMIGPRAGVVIYNEACAHAADGNTDKALESLDEAFERGYVDVESARNDPEFESLQANEAFVALLEKHERLIIERMVAETKEQLSVFETYDFDFKLKNLDGEDVNLADLKGKLVIIDFWGTWCAPCIAEIPHFIALKKEYADQGLEIVGLAYEHAEDAEEAMQLVKDFVAESGINYPCALGDETTQELVPDFQGFPTTLFIDREGVVRLQLTGAQPHAKLESVVKELVGSGDQ
jgi:thiol-disulfide isomerase/thioredoxin